MTYDYKRLCNELLSYLYQCNWPDAKKFYTLVERARVALAEPEPEGPTDEELLETVRHLYGDQIAADMGAADDLFTARAVLTRWGRPTPAEGEMAELVAWLRETSSRAFLEGWPNEESINLTRAADLLERLSPPRPIPVSERLPGPEDCDSQGRCWGFHQYNREDDDIWDSWQFLPAPYLLPSVQWLGFSHWLPANALPQPS